MSKPNIHKQNFIDNTISDCISAVSALNMLPSPIENPEGDFLCNTDEWAKHAEEHLMTIITNLKYAQAIKESAMKLLSEGKIYDAVQLLVKL